MPRLWNKLPTELRQPVDDESLSLTSHRFIITIIITTFTMHHSVSVPLQTQNLPF